MANIELPKDAEGREIPLDTVVLFDAYGKPVNIVRWAYTTDFNLKDSWVNSWRAINEDLDGLDPELMYLTPPDSWEKLLADLKRGASIVHHPECAYFGRDENDCDQCEAVCSFACKKIAFGNIESRIRKLMGEDK